MALTNNPCLLLACELAIVSCHGTVSKCSLLAKHRWRFWRIQREQHPLIPFNCIHSWKKEAVEDVNVTFEDQQKINKFARNTSRMTELKNEIAAKKKSLQNLQDASDDLMMLDDDALLIPYQIGDVFISHTQEETQEMLEAAKLLHTFVSVTLQPDGSFHTEQEKLLGAPLGEHAVPWLIVKKDFSPDPSHLCHFERGLSSAHSTLCLLPSVI